MKKRFSRKTSDGYKKVTPETFGLSSPKDRKYYPTVTFDLKDLPEAKDWKVGDKYVIHIIAEMRSISKAKDYDSDEEKSNASFEIHEVDGGEAVGTKKRYIRSK